MTSLGHTRSSSLMEARNSPMAGNDVFSPPPPSGRHGGDSRSGGTPMPHIDDILTAPRDIDMNQSIRRLIESAESSLRQAEMSRDFQRPSLALKEYIRASIIAVQVIRNHRDYVSLKADHPDLARSHNVLLKKITLLDADFAGIKQDIIADNERTGVQPAKQRPGSSHSNGAGSRPMSPTKGLARSTNASPRPSANRSLPAKTKPTIHPKPQALHGNAINRSSFSLSTSAAQDLAARFANLRGPQPSPGQDPRIKTHQIDIPPKPAGPRAMPPPPPRPPKIDVNNNVPTLPKMPDAIYSPARGSIETPRLPGATRGVYSRTGSLTSSSVPGTPTGTSQTQNDYFTPTQSYSNTSMPPAKPESTIKIPSGDSITPEQLVEAMRRKGSILLIDVRFREDFNEGHIMFSQIVCIEPSILLRENISADQIAESLILSPGQEESEFQNRDAYDLIVFYDQNSETVPRHPRNSDDLVIASLRQALVDFNYGHELRNPPKLLKGGIDAWVDLMGSGSLQTAERPTLRVMKPSARNRSGTIERKLSKFVAKPHKPDVARAWEETIKNEDRETASSPNFVRSTEEFLRKYPAVVPEKESMSLPSKPRPSPSYGSSHQVDLYTDLPSPPTRPAPALPRPSYSGISEAVHENEGYGTPTTPGTERIKAVERQFTGDNTKPPTGLNNPGNWCYANSILQCLLASPGFGRELSNSLWVDKYKVPKKLEEKIENPQLMMKIITNLFHWMISGKFGVMKAQTLMNYSLYLAQQQDCQPFGSQKQQDAQEYMSFLFDNLHDETNLRRDHPGVDVQPNTKSQPLVQASIEFWRGHISHNRSIINKYWRGVDVGTVRCLKCNTRTYTFAPFDFISLIIPSNRQSMTLEQALDEHIAQNPIDDFQCDRCKSITRAVRYVSLARAPPLLCVSLSRFHFAGAAGKTTTRIIWDFDETDFSPYFMPEFSARDNQGNPTDQAFTGPFRYEIYGVIVHSGSSSTAGHYYAYVRDVASRDPYAWFCCNDNNVTRVRIGSGGSDDIKERVFKHQEQVPYLLFFRRKPMV